MSETDEANVPGLVRLLRQSDTFKEKYIPSSLFYMGYGTYSYLFRVVTKAEGLENPRYPMTLVQNLQELMHNCSNKRDDLVDADRDDACLDLVAMKVESLRDDKMHKRPPPSCNLIREFIMLKELFSRKDPKMSMVGIPLPIDYGFFGEERMHRSLSETLTRGKTGQHVSYEQMYIKSHYVPCIRSAEDVRLDSYMTLEMVGLSMEDWRRYFKPAEPGGSVHFSVQTTFKLMDQVLCRLLVIHRKDVVHLDLRPDNIRMGCGNRINTVYLVSYRMSRVCSNYRPLEVMGNLEYMPTGVHRRQASSYIMDIESWFYVLTTLLVDHLPWKELSATPVVDADSKDDDKRPPVVISEEKRQKLVMLAKESFWDVMSPTAEEMMDRVEKLHGDSVSDARVLYRNIYLHIQEMRRVFGKMDHKTMNNQINHETSDLYRSYKRLRHLLLYIYDCNFQSIHSCFRLDQDLHEWKARRSGRENKLPLLFYASGADWQWDWDVWHSQSQKGDDTTKQEHRRRKKTKKVTIR